MITQILLTQTFIMFILMILGLILSKTGLLTEHGSKDMANILLYAVIPCVIIRSYITDFTMEKLYGLLMSAVLAVAAFAVAIAVSYIIYGMRKPIDNFGTAFCNAGFIGIPLVTAVFGNEAAFYVASFASILNLLQWTYGIVIPPKTACSRASSSTTCPPQGYDKYKKGIRQSCDNITCYRTVSFYYGN